MVARKHMKKNTQVAQFANSSGSISQLKWFNQATQVVQLASSDVSVS